MHPNKTTSLIYLYQTKGLGSHLLKNSSELDRNKWAYAGAIFVTITVPCTLYHQAQNIWPCNYIVIVNGNWWILPDAQSLTHGFQLLIWGIFGLWPITSAVHNKASKYCILLNECFATYYMNYSWQMAGEPLTMLHFLPETSNLILSPSDTENTSKTSIDIVRIYLQFYINIEFNCVHSQYTNSWNLKCTRAHIKSLHRTLL